MMELNEYLPNSNKCALIGIFIYQEHSVKTNKKIHRNNKTLKFIYVQHSLE